MVCRPGAATGERAAMGWRQAAARLVTTTSVAVAMVIPVGVVLTAGSAGPAGAATCVAYDQTSATTPVTVSATPSPIAPAGSLAAGQSVVVTVTGYDASGSCASGGPVWLYFDGPGTAVPEVAADSRLSSEQNIPGGPERTGRRDSQVTPSSY
jgi:hypothetical protein